MAERIYPTNTSELLYDIEQEWSRLMATVEKLTPDQFIRPDAGGWSPKDNLAHLTEWMKILIGYYMDGRPAAEVCGIPQEEVKDWDFERMNKIFYERNHNRSIDDVVDEMKLVYSEVVARLESTPFEDLMKPRFPDDLDKQPLLNWVLGNTSEHFAEHRENILRAVASA